MENLVNIEHLSNLLSIPSVTYDEWDMVEYLSKHFDEKGYEYGVDHYGNIFVNKGTDEVKPLICAHIDTVHKKTKINHAPAQVHAIRPAAVLALRLGCCPPFKPR